MPESGSSGSAEHLGEEAVGAMAVGCDRKCFTMAECLCSRNVESFGKRHGCEILVGLADRGNDFLVLGREHRASGVDEQAAGRE